MNLRGIKKILLLVSTFVFVGFSPNEDLKLKTGAVLLNGKRESDFNIEVDDSLQARIVFFACKEVTILIASPDLSCNDKCYEGKMTERKTLMLIEGLKLIKWDKISDLKYEVVYKTISGDKKYFYNEKINNYWVSISGEWNLNYKSEYKQVYARFNFQNAQ